MTTLGPTVRTLLLMLAGPPVLLLLWAHLLRPLADWSGRIAVISAALYEKVKTALTVVLGAALAWNVWRIGELMRDFEYLKPLPIW